MPILRDAPDEYTYHVSRRLNAARRDVQKLDVRYISISTYYLNRNSYSDDCSLRNFRFRTYEIPRLSDLMGCVEGTTKRIGYRANSILSCCIVLRRLTAHKRWFHLETQFGLHTSAFSEIFWECIEAFVHSMEHLLEFRAGLIGQREKDYIKAMEERGSPLKNIAGFIDCPKIQMSRPGGSGAPCYSGHKRFICLIYQSVTIPDGLMYHLYGPEVGRRHDMT